MFPPAKLSGNKGCRKRGKREGLCLSLSVVEAILRHAQQDRGHHTCLNLRHFGRRFCQQLWDQAILGVYLKQKLVLRNVSVC